MHSKIILFEGIYLSDIGQEKIENISKCSNQNIFEELEKAELLEPLMEFIAKFFSEYDKTKYDTIPSVFISLDKWPKKTNLLCWNCCETPLSIPFFIPNGSYHSSEGYNICVHGVACDERCAMNRLINHRDPKIINVEESKKAIYYLRDIFYPSRSKSGIIEPRPDYTILRKFCGPSGMTLIQYKRKFYKK